MKHRWDPYVPPDVGARALLMPPMRKCLNCGIVQTEEQETAWMRVVSRKWRPLAGRCKGKVEHRTKVDVTTYSRGNRTWRIECSCGWEWDTSVRGTRQREVEARARAHEKEHNDG